jgi:exosortase A-associated hydrolase 1
MHRDGGYREQALALTCGAATLPAILTLPASAAPQPPGTRGVLVIVGGPQYRAGSHRQFTLLARSLAAQGIPVMRFDARGMGDAEGGQRTFEDLAEDVRAATDCFMRAVPGLRDVVLWGLCDGAAAAVLHGGSDERISGLVLLNPWARDEAGLAKAMLKHYYLRRLADPALWRKVFSGRFDLRASAASLAAHIGQALRPPSRPPVAGVGPADAASTLVAGAGPGPDAMSTVAAAVTPPVPAAVTPSAPAVAAPPLGPRLLAGLQRFPGPILLVISPGDLTAMEFLDLAGSSRAWRTLMRSPRITRRDLPGADHTFSSRAWRDQVAEWTGQWLRSW